MLDFTLRCQSAHFQQCLHVDACSPSPIAFGNESNGQAEASAHSVIPCMPTTQPQPCRHNAGSCQALAGSFCQRCKVGVYKAASARNKEDFKNIKEGILLLTADVFMKYLCMHVCVHINAESIIITLHYT